MPTTEASSDIGTPTDLLPSSGRVAKDRTTYQSVYLTEVPQNDKPRPLDGQIDLTEPSSLYQRPAEGVVVTTEQEWLPKQLGLGRLLHSLSLAPGESTRVAVLDWSRQVAARTAQATTQAEEATAESERGRGVSAITDALAREEQFGASAATSHTTSSSRSGSAGISLFGGGIGGSSSRSRTAGVATSVSRSSGSRELSSRTSQRIQERTQQLATSSRDRRATVVQETSEAEAVAASTRVVTNYNHMHALTMEYWEVIQEYELRTRTKRCDRCLFVPMKVLTFDDAVFKRYHQVLIDAAPPSWAERVASVDPFETAVYRTRSSSGSNSESSLTGPQPQVVPMGPNPPRLIHLDPVAGRIVVVNPDGSFPVAEGQEFQYWGITDERDRRGAVGWDRTAATWVPLGLCTLRETVSKNQWHVKLVGSRLDLMWAAPGQKTKNARSRIQTNTEFTDPETGTTYRVDERGTPVMSRDLQCVAIAEQVPTSGAEQLSAWWDDSGFRAIQLSMRNPDPDAVIGSPSDAANATVDFEPDERVTQIVLTSEATPWGRALRRITIATDRPQHVELGPDVPEGMQTTDERIPVRDAVLCGIFGSVDPITQRIVSAGFQLRGPHMRQEILDHLNDNELYYSRAIWANADELALTRILANYEYDDGLGGEAVPLGARLDSTPVAMTGNYLGFRWHFPDEEKRRAWLNGQELDEADGDDESSWTTTTTVSIPTDGVFAEAVLGRSNAAEKLDITRFWDWQTSPIPILPSEIAPVDTGSRARDVAAETGGLAPTAAVIRTLPSLPEPTGAAAGLQAIAAGNLFRDMSGLQATSDLLQKGLELASENDWKSAEQATKAMEQANEHMEKMSQIAVDTAKEVAPLVLGPAGAAAGAVGNASKLGALLNFASSAASADESESASTAE